jgi:hypothetical protein
MSDAIALSSPSGRTSKRAKKAAADRLALALFGANATRDDFTGTQQQPTEKERLLAQAGRLRDLAARGMSTRKFTKEAARLEAQAALSTANRSPEGRTMGRDYADTEMTKYYDAEGVLRNEVDDSPVEPPLPKRNRSAEENWANQKLTRAPFSIRQLKAIVDAIPEWALDRAICFTTHEGGPLVAVTDAYLETDGRTITEPILWLSSED